MIVSKNKDLPYPTILPGYTRPENVENSKYLGTTFNWNAKDYSEILIRKALATKALNYMKSTLRNKGLSFDVRRKVFMAYVFPIPTYNSETWNISAQMVKKLKSFEMRGFRKM